MNGIELVYNGNGIIRTYFSKETKSHHHNNHPNNHHCHISNTNTNTPKKQIHHQEKIELSASAEYSNLSNSNHSHRNSHRDRGSGKHFELELELDSTPTSITKLTPVSPSSISPVSTLSSHSQSPSQSSSSSSSSSCYEYEPTYTSILQKQKQKQKQERQSQSEYQSHSQGQEELEKREIVNTNITDNNLVLETSAKQPTDPNDDCDEARSLCTTTTTNNNMGNNIGNNQIRVRNKRKKCYLRNLNQNQTHTQNQCDQSQSHIHIPQDENEEEEHQVHQEHGIESDTGISVNDLSDGLLDISCSSLSTEIPSFKLEDDTDKNNDVAVDDDDDNNDTDKDNNDNEDGEYMEQSFNLTKSSKWSNIRSDYDYITRQRLKQKKEQTLKQSALEIKTATIPATATSTLTTAPPATATNTDKIEKCKYVITKPDKIRRAPSSLTSSLTCSMGSIVSSEAENDITNESDCICTSNGHVKDGEELSTPSCLIPSSNSPSTSPRRSPNYRKNCLRKSIPRPAMVVRAPSSSSVRFMDVKPSIEDHLSRAKALLNSARNLQKRLDTGHDSGNDKSTFCFNGSETSQYNHNCSESFQEEEDNYDDAND